MKRRNKGLSSKLVLFAVGSLMISLGVSTAAMAKEVDSLLPERSQQEIAEKWNQWMNGSTDTEEPFAIRPSGQAPYQEGKLNSGYLQNGVDAANFYRFISGLPADLQLNDALNDQAQYGAILLAEIGRLSHSPAKPAGMPEDIYQKGLKSTSSSNLFKSYGTSGNILARSVNLYMDDSDVSNIDRLGHRRWILNPPLQKIGFGLAFQTEADGSQTYFSPMQVFDQSRTGFGGYNYSLFPSRGAFPLEAFGSQQAWSVQLNPKVFQEPSSQEVQVELTRLSDNANWTFTYNMQTEGFPQAYVNVDESNVAWYQQAYFNVDTTQYGYNYAIIFRPDLLVPLHDGDQFKVHITGLKKTDGTPAEISYQTNFFSITHAPDEQLKSIEVNKQSLTVRAGEAVHIPTVIAQYDQGTRYDVSSKVSLSSTSDNVRIENNAIIGVKQGKARVALNYGGKTTDIDIEVYEVAQFADVQSHWAHDAIQWALDKRMVSGYADGTFKPNQQVTEAEFLSMLFTLYADSDMIQSIEANANFKNTPQKTWDDKYYGYAEYMNVDMGQSVSDRNYRKHIMTRGEVARIVASLGGKNFTNVDDAIQYLLVMGYATGKTGATVEGYAGQDPLTRAEAVVFLKNLSGHDYSFMGKPDKITELTDNEKMGMLADLTIKANFREDHTLQLTGNLSEMANKAITVKIHGPSPAVNYIQTENTQVDADGNFTLTTGAIDAASLNIYVYIRDDYSYFIDVDLGKEKINSYAYTRNK